MKTALFIIKIWDNDFVFDSDQDSYETIKEIYEKRIKPKYPNFDFDVWVEDDEDYDEENECNAESLFLIRHGVVK